MGAPWTGRRGDYGRGGEREIEATGHGEQSSNDSCGNDKDASDEERNADNDDIDGNEKNVSDEGSDVDNKDSEEYGENDEEERN